MADDPATIASVIDLDRYPIHAPHSAEARALVARCRAALDVGGACQVPGFLRPRAVAALVAEALDRRDLAWRTDGEHTVYVERPAADAPAGSAGTLLQHTSKSAVAWDLVGSASPLRTAYEWDGLTSFLGAALEVTPLHRYADPLAAASLMIFDEGDELGWHFDRSPFAVTVMLQESDGGGEYQYHHHLRSDGDENEAGVLAALADEQPGRRTLASTPGTLSLFRGRYSMHRVTPVRGARPRINAVLAYSPRPGDRLHRHSQELFYGRSAGSGRLARGADGAGNP